MTADPLLLAIDDEPGILRLISLELSALGFRVITAPSVNDAMPIIEHQRPDVILLDIVMPGMTGLEGLRAIRERSTVPIILVTAKDREMDKVRGLEMGADDYVVKPFSTDELGARIRAVVRRARGSAPDRVLCADGVGIDLNRRVVTRRDGCEIALTRTEWQLLEYLAANAGKVLLSAELLTKVWGPEYRDDLQYLRVWVSRIRQKLESNPSEPRIIQTRQGIGYTLLPADKVAVVV